MIRDESLNKKMDKFDVFKAMKRDIIRFIRISNKIRDNISEMTPLEDYDADMVNYFTTEENTNLDTLITELLVAIPETTDISEISEVITAFPPEPVTGQPVDIIELP